MRNELLFAVVALLVILDVRICALWWRAVNDDRPERYLIPRAPGLRSDSRRIS